MYLFLDIYTLKVKKIEKGVVWSQCLVLKQILELI